MENTQHDIVLAGAGNYGTCHIDAISKHEKINPDIRLAAIVDIDPNALLYQDARTSAQLCWNRSAATDENRAEFDNLTEWQKSRIRVVDSIAEVIKDADANTFVNATTTPAHVSVLEDALSVRDLASSPIIRTIFQEKPFAEHLHAAEDIAQTIRDHDIRFTMNSVLMFSPIWDSVLYEQEKLAKAGFSLIAVDCSYGKNRTLDERPATNGWAGMDGVHALDIVTRMLNDDVEIHYSKGLKGFLADGASEDGIVIHSYECEGDAGDVQISLEGSFAWDEQVRRAQFYYRSDDLDVFDDHILEVNFDIQDQGIARDSIRYFIENSDGETFQRYASAYDNNQIRTINDTDIVYDKLFRYYENGFSNDPVLCDLDRALSLQSTIETMLNPEEIIHMDADVAPESPSFVSISENVTSEKDWFAEAQGKKKSLKRWPLRHPILSALFLSAAIQLTPELASQDSADYLNDNNYPESLAQSFDTDQIRVYGRYNPLSSLHFMGRPLGLTIENPDDDPVQQAQDIALSPLSMLFTGLMAAGNYLPPYTAADAFAVPNENGTCFVRPPSAEVDTKYILELFTGIEAFGDVDTLQIDNDIEAINDAFRTTIMAHEMRHCEQPRDLPAGNMHESDADIVAIRILNESGYDQDVVDEAYKLYLAARLISALGGGSSHDTGLNIISGHTVSLHSYKTLSAQRILSDLVSGLSGHHDFPETMGGAERDFQTIVALRSSGLLDEFEDEVNEFAQRYIDAFIYLNRVSGRTAIIEPGYFREIDVDYLYEDITQESIPEIEGFKF